MKVLNFFFNNNNYYQQESSVEKLLVYRQLAVKSVHTDTRGQSILRLGTHWPLPWIIKLV